MTPACRLLKQKKVAYSVHEYEHDPACSNFGAEAAAKLGLGEAQVFKTLLVTDGKQYFVCVLPVSARLSLKKVAITFGVKKLAMAQPADAERITGYLVGGISPLGQKKLLKTAIDQSAIALEKIYISGGKRGLDIGLSPDALATLLSALFVDLKED